MILHYLLVVQTGKLSQLQGLLKLPQPVDFSGAETSYEREFPNNVQVTTPLMKYTLSSGAWTMAAVFSKEQLLNKEHTGPDFVSIADAGPGIDWTSGSGLANHLRYVDGLALKSITALGATSKGSAPQLFTSVSISGTMVVGNTIQLVVPPDLWQGPVDESAYTWQKLENSVWTTVPGANSIQFVPTSPGFYRGGVAARNAYGWSASTYTPPVNIVAV